MKLVKVGAAVLNQTPLSWRRNADNIRAAVDSARHEGVSILCLPELCITGYGCEDAFHSPATQETAWQVLHELLPECEGLVVTLGLPVFYRNALFNAAALVVDGRVAGFVAKRNLASDGIHYEPRWFKPWPEGVRGTVELLDGTPAPIGDLWFDVGGVRLGFEICEDAWAVQRPGARLARKGVDVILNTSASHFAFGKLEIRKRFVEEGSRAFGVVYLYANLVGNEAGRALYDGGALVAAGGAIVAQGPRFTYRDTGVTSAVVDVALSRMHRTRPVSFTPIMDSDETDRVVVPWQYPELEPVLPRVDLEPWETGPWLKEEEFLRAEALGLFDYLRKSGLHGFAVSLSGGADSTAVATLVAFMVRLGVAELGLGGLADRLGHIPGLREATTVGEAVRRLLVCVYQGTANSSTTTREAARTVAEGLGAEFIAWEVGDLVGAYRSLVGGAVGRELSWERDDMALQNIQARVRAPGIWLLANIRNFLLLSTSNRSEAAVGYATMDGDTCGGLAPIAGIDKNYLRSWLRWLEVTGPTGMEPVSAVGAVNALPPTAELRPPERHQTDEADLMPYDVLDVIERAAIRDKLSPDDIHRLLVVRWPEHGPRTLAGWVVRFFRLWARNQWKRERYAPSFHLDDENLDPKTWCRFPILSGGFERELAALALLAAGDGIRARCPAV